MRLKWARWMVPCLLVAVFTSSISFAQMDVVERNIANRILRDDVLKQQLPHAFPQMLPRSPGTQMVPPMMAPSGGMAPPGGTGFRPLTGSSSAASPTVVDSQQALRSQIVQLQAAQVSDQEFVIRNSTSSVFSALVKNGDANEVITVGSNRDIKWKCVDCDKGIMLSYHDGQVARELSIKIKERYLIVVNPILRRFDVINLSELASLP
jgi:hypothetical protein